MQPPDAMQQQIIVTMLGDVPTLQQPSGILAASIVNLWNLHAGQLNAAVKFLLVKRDAVDMLIGTCRLDVNFRADTLQVNLSDKIKALQAMRPTDVDITRAYKTAQGSSYASGQLTTTAPTTPPYPWRDGNDPRYAGSPYYPWPWGIGQVGV